MSDTPEPTTAELIAEGRRLYNRAKDAKREADLQALLEDAIRIYKWVERNGSPTDRANISLFLDAVGSVRKDRGHLADHVSLLADCAEELEKKLWATDATVVEWRGAAETNESRAAKAEGEAERQKQNALTGLAMIGAEPSSQPAYTLAVLALGYKGQMEKAETERDALAARVKELEDALDEIASWREGPEWNTMFQEPNAAKIARDTLSLAADRGGKSPE